ncbi:VOC family protein [candidate division KSB1 bacterium]
MLHHFGITINSREEIKDFYSDILGFQYAYEFELASSKSKLIFNVHDDLQVIVMKGYGIKLELFIKANLETRNINHICLAFQNSEEVYYKAKSKGYWSLKLSRTDENGFNYFVKDSSDNLFELKDLFQ